MTTEIVGSIQEASSLHSLVRRLIVLEAEYEEFVKKRDALPLTVMKLEPWYKLQAEIDAKCGDMMRTERRIIRTLVAEERGKAPNISSELSAPASAVTKTNPDVAAGGD